MASGATFKVFLKTKGMDGQEALKQKLQVLRTGWLATEDQDNKEKVEEATAAAQSFTVSIAADLADGTIDIDDLTAERCRLFVIIKPTCEVASNRSSNNSSGNSSRC